MTAQIANLPSVTSVAFVGLAVVLVLGLVTAVRISKRNFHTDELIDCLTRLRYLLRPQDANLLSATLPWTEGETPAKERRNATCHRLMVYSIRLRGYLLQLHDGNPLAATLPWTKKRRNAILHAGLLQVVYLANAVVPALGIVASKQRDSDAVLVASAVMVALLLQLSLAFRANQREWLKRLEKNEHLLRALTLRRESDGSNTAECHYS